MFGKGNDPVECSPDCTAVFSVSYACTYCRPGWPFQACPVLPEQALWNVPQSVRKDGDREESYTSFSMFSIFQIIVEVFSALYEFDNYFLSMHSTGQGQTPIALF